MNLEHKISQAKAKLLVEYPFFGTIASRLSLLQNDDIQNFKSDGSTLEYNDTFLEQLSNNEMLFVLSNAAMHASLAHQERKQNRSGWLWHLATDYAINDMLVENGFEYPDGVNYSKRFSGLYAEEIYAQLKDDILRDELEYEADENDDVQNNSSKEQSELESELLGEMAQSLLESELAKGESIGSIERFFRVKHNSSIDWRDELKYAIDKYAKDDFTLLPPNKKFLYMGYYLPSATSEKFRVVIGVDSSGSVDEVLLSKFLAEIEFLMLSIQNYEIDILVCDEKIHSHKRFFQGDRLEVFLKGGGSTDFRPVFEYVERELQDTQLLLYFSDLEGIFPTLHPRYDVKWVCTVEKELPFGEMIVMDNYS